MSGKLRASDIISFRMPDARVSPIRCHQSRSTRASSSERAAVEVADQVDALDDLVDDVLAHDLLQQVFLARVVQVERALRDAGPGRDLFGSRRREALLDEQVERGIEQLLRTRFLAALAARCAASTAFGGGRAVEGGHWY